MKPRNLAFAFAVSVSTALASANASPAPPPNFHDLVRDYVLHNVPYPFSIRNARISEPFAIQNLRGETVWVVCLRYLARGRLGVEVEHYPAIIYQNGKIGERQPHINCDRVRYVPFAI